MFKIPQKKIIRKQFFLVNAFCAHSTTQKYIKVEKIGFAHSYPLVICRRDFWVEFFQKAPENILPAQYQSVPRESHNITLSSTYQKEPLFALTWNFSDENGISSS